MCQRAVLGGHEALREEGVALIFGPDVGDAEFVAIDFDRGLQAVQLQSARKLWNSRRQLSRADCVCAGHGAHLARSLHDDNTPLD